MSDATLRIELEDVGGNVAVDAPSPSGGSASRASGVNPSGGNRVNEQVEQTRAQRMLSAWENISRSFAEGRGVTGAVSTFASEAGVFAKAASAVGAFVTALQLGAGVMTGIWRTQTAVAQLEGERMRAIIVDRDMTSARIREEQQRITKIQGGWSAGGKIAGTASGAAAGATIGTMILPGVGTAIGTVIGAIVGYKVGEAAGEAVGDTIGSYLTKKLEEEEILAQSIKNSLSQAAKDIGKFSGQLGAAVARSDFAEIQRQQMTADALGSQMAAFTDVETRRKNAEAKTAALIQMETIATQRKDSERRVAEERRAAETLAAEMRKNFEAQAARDAANAKTEGERQKVFEDMREKLRAIERIMSDQQRPHQPLEDLMNSVEVPDPSGWLDRRKEEVKRRADDVLKAPRFRL